MPDRAPGARAVTLELVAIGIVFAPVLVPFAAVCAAFDLWRIWRGRRTAVKVLRLLLCVGLLVSGARVLEAQTPVATIVDSIGWDYTQAQITTGSVDHFVVCLDSTPCVQVTVAAAKHPTLGPDVYFWKLPAMLPGAHTWSVVACNQTVCSGPLNLNFQFVAAPPNPANARLIKG